MSSWRPQWQTEGQEPDYRFSLANERTFLAWIRTALAVLAAAVVARQFAPQSALGGTLHVLVILLALLAGLMAGAAYLRWKSHEVAMRHGRPLAAAASIATVAVGAVCLAVGAVVLLAAR